MKCSDGRLPDRREVLLSAAGIPLQGLIRWRQTGRWRLRRLLSFTTGWRKQKGGSRTIRMRWSLRRRRRMAIRRCAQFFSRALMTAVSCSTRTRRAAREEELAVNPRVALLFYWKSLKRQIRIEGMAEHVTEAEADAYFESRPRNSRLGAWASPQSRPLDNRTILEERLAEMEKRYPDAIPRPDYWSGYRVLPEMFEFWQEMPYRLHDRTVYRRSAGGVWEQSKLFP